MDHNHQSTTWPSWKPSSTVTPTPTTTITTPSTTTTWWQKPTEQTTTSPWWTTTKPPKDTTTKSTTISWWTTTTKKPTEKPSTTTTVWWQPAECNSNIFFPQQNITWFLLQRQQFHLLESLCQKCQTAELKEHLVNRGHTTATHTTVTPTTVASSGKCDGNIAPEDCTGAKRRICAIGQQMLNAAKHHNRVT